MNKKLTLLIDETTIHHAKEYAEKNPFFKKVLDSQIAFAKSVYPYHKRVLELYFNMVKTAHEQHK